MPTQTIGFMTYVNWENPSPADKINIAYVRAQTPEIRAILCMENTEDGDRQLAADVLWQTGVRFNLEIVKYGDMPSAVLKNFNPADYPIDPSMDLKVKPTNWREQANADGTSGPGSWWNLNSPLPPMYAVYAPPTGEEFCVIPNRARRNNVFGYRVK